MTAAPWLATALFFALVLGLAPWLGRWLAAAFGDAPYCGDRLLGPLERACYRLAGVDATRSMDWRDYARALLAFQVPGFIAVYALQRLQHLLPANAQGAGPVRPDLAFDTAVSFVTNTDWQAYGGETTLSSLVQMLGLGVQNFLSAASGLAVLAALARALRPGVQPGLGNCWRDLVRGTLHVLLPMATVFALALAAQGVVQSFAAWPQAATLADPQVTQTLPLGPVASQTAIQMLGTNGGGFFNANGAHPFANPTPLTDFLQLLAILLLPAACCTMFGQLVRDRRQGRALLATMTALLLLAVAACWTAEQSGNPRLDALGVDQHASSLQGGGNLEGKEVRNGTAASALWACATTAASNGAVNAMHDSFTPLGGLVPMVLMQLGEVVFGGVGSGLYGMLLFVVVAVFLAGLMVGRSPEYLGKRIEPFAMQMAMLAVLLPCALVLLGTALAVLVPDARGAAGNPGPHGFSQILYAFSSAANNNGSAFAGLDAARPFYTVALAVCMLLARYGVIVPVLALAGAFAQQRSVPPSPGTLPTHGVLFCALLALTVLLVGALTFLPALALGPIAEHLQLHGGGR